MSDNTTDQASEQFDAAWGDACAEKPSTATQFSPLGSALMKEFHDAERMRNEVELRWLKDLRQYRGKYDPDVEAELADRSKAFKRLTATKVDTLTALMLDMLFPSGKEKNYSIAATERPSLPPCKMDQLKAQLRQAAGGNPLPKDAIKQAIKEVADTAATKMGEEIDDQLQEGRYRREIKGVLFSGHLYGSGVLKGPLATRQTNVSHVWDNKTRRYVEKVSIKTRPVFKQIPLWRWYPDMEATELENCRFVWEHHRLTKAGLLELAERKGFDTKIIRDYATANKDGCTTTRTYESDLRAIGERESGTAINAGLYDVFERYGWVDAADLAQCGVDVPPERLHEVVFANIWMLPSGDVIRAQLLRPGTSYPFHLYQFREDETNIFAEGIATVMRDDQDMANAATRAALDNAAITAGPQLVANQQELAPNTDYATVHPFKLWLQTKGDSQYSPLKAVDLPNHTSALLQLAQYFETSADDTTMIPRYMSGDNPTAGAAGTMGGLSMLMGQGRISIKSLAVNFDEGITRPAITALVRWNMLYHPDMDIKGDYVVSARGSSSLVAKEVRAQQASQFAASLAPEERQYVKFLPLLRERAQAAEFEGVVMTDAEAKDAEQNPAVQQAQQLQQVLQQLTVAKTQAEIANLNADVSKKQMAAVLDKARAMELFVRGLYEAIQGAGIVIRDPKIAAAADEIARSAGFADQTPQQPMPVAEGGMPAQMPVQTQEQASPQPASPAVGAMAGMQTPEIGMGA